jgi:hypothetical protein
MPEMLDEPAKMTPQQRRQEIADILAGGFLRLRRRPGYVPDAEHGGHQPAENSFSPSAALRLTGRSEMPPW